MSVFIGELDNHRFVVAQSYGHKKQAELTEAMLNVSPEQGFVRLPVFNAAGWAIHAATEELSHKEVADRIHQAVPTEKVEVLVVDSETLRQEMEAFLGHDAVEHAFSAPLRVPKAATPEDTRVI